MSEPDNRTGPDKSDMSALGELYADLADVEAQLGRAYARLRQFTDEQQGMALRFQATYPRHRPGVVAWSAAGAERRFSMWPELDALNLRFAPEKAAQRELNLRKKAVEKAIRELIPPSAKPKKPNKINKSP